VAELVRIFDFQNGGHPPSWLFVFSQFLWKIQICAFILVVQNLVKIALSAAELLCIFDFQNGGHPPSWIFIFPHFLWKIQICISIFVVVQNLVKIRLSRPWPSYCVFSIFKMAAVSHLGLGMTS